MGSNGERAFEVVVLAGAFRDPRGRSFIEEYFPPFALALYDAVVADPRWHAASTLAEQGLVVDSILRESIALSDGYQRSVAAGELGFGDGEDAEVDAAIEQVERVLDTLPPLPVEPPHIDIVESAPPDGVDLEFNVDLGFELGFGGSGSADRALDDLVFEIDEGGLLGGDEPTTEWRPPAPIAPPERTVEADAIETHLNAKIDDDGRPLEVNRKYTFEVFYGEKDPDAQVTAHTTVFIPRESDSIDLTVQLVSDDFTVPRHAQTLTLTRNGASESSALFQITPLHDGPATVTIVVDVNNNFLQRVDVTYDVGVATEPDVVQYGRPVGAADVLERREARLEFLPAAGGYELHAPQLFPNERIRVLITPDELANRITAVRTVLLEWVQKREIAREMKLEPEISLGFRNDLAEKGFRLFQSIFRGPEASESLKAVGAWLRESLSGDTVTLQVVSTGFPVPWALMYLTDRFDESSLEWENFIGMRHVVEQVRMTASDVVPPPATIASTPELTVRTIYNDGIDQEIPGEPVAGQREYWSTRGVTLHEGNTVDDLVTVALTPSAADQVLYLYCHAASSPTADTDAASITLTGRQSVTLERLWLSAPDDDQLAGRPLVFLNACESGDMSPNFYDGFMPYFLAKGARGVIGTECKMPGLFAAAWAKAFFDELFAGMPLGEVVLTLRRHFLETYRNPLGLLYGVHCDTDTVVTPALPTPA